MFDWWHFLLLAEKLAAAEDEASKRSATSRAYYALYLTARDYLIATKQDFFLPKSGESSHDKVWQRFDIEKEKRHKQIAINGWKLKRLRVSADYEKRAANVDNSKEIAQTILRAKWMLNLLCQLQNGQ